MTGYLPGTTVEVGSGIGAKEFLDMAFAANGLVLSQVSQLTGLGMHTIQNWVKRKFVASPEQKKYDKNSFCRIAIINMLKDTFQIEKIVKMLDGFRLVYGGDASVLIYTCFSDLLDRTPPNAIEEATRIDEIIADVINERDIKDDIVVMRLKKVLKMILLSQLSSNIKREAELVLEDITQNG